MTKPIIYLLSIAGSDRDLASVIGLPSSRKLVEHIQNIVGSNYKVCANTKMMDCVVDANMGGRNDDKKRSRELNKVFSNDNVKALVSLRGGSWLTRILPDIDFDILKNRKNVLHIFGFSELTTLVNIASGYSKVRAYYDIAPAYLLHVARNKSRSTKVEMFASLLEDIINILENNETCRKIAGQLVQGTIKKKTAKVTGGCLSVLVALLGSQYRKNIDTKGKWLAIEDLQEYPHRIDRYLAQLKLAGMFDRCEGLILGDFHYDNINQNDAVLRLLKYHLPCKKNHADNK